MQWEEEGGGAISGQTKGEQFEACVKLVFSCIVCNPCNHFSGIGNIFGIDEHILTANTALQKISSQNHCDKVDACG